MAECRREPFLLLHGVSGFRYLGRWDRQYEQVLGNHLESLIGVRVYGYDADTFDPNDVVTCEQMVTILYNYVQIQTRDSDEAQATTMSALAFSDASQISDYALAPMTWVCENQIMVGYEDGLLDPQGATTCAQTATMILKLANLIDLIEK